MRKIAFIFAHPDDESFATGGTIAHYAKKPDVEVHLICATRGEVGKTGSPPQCLPEQLGQVRESELRKAAHILGIHSLTFLDFIDGTLSHYSSAEIIDAFLPRLLEISPDAVITFAAHGISGHLDHRAIHQATKACVEGQHLPSVKALYYVTIPESIGKLAGSSVYTDPDDKIDVRIDTREYRRQVMEALQAHKTQNMSVAKVYPGVLEGSPNQIQETEYYMLGWHTPDFNVRPNTLL